MEDSNNSHAAVIPPPSRYSGKLKVLINVASNVPSARPTESKIWSARGLPPLARWYTSSEERSGPKFNRRAMAETAVAEAYFSTQPVLPQPHGYPLGEVVMWPISPAIP